MQLITTSRAAKILQTSEGTVRALERRGELRWVEETHAARSARAMDAPTTARPTMLNKTGSNTIR